MVLRIARWCRVRVPVARARIAPKRNGPQHRRLRQLLQDVVPPAWVRQVVVVAAAGCAAKATRYLSTAIHDPAVCARPRPRQCTTGTPRRDLVQHLPPRWSSRRASHTPDGRRRDSGVFPRRATRHQLGAVTRVVSKKRRHEGPKGVNIIVTHLTEASAGAVLSRYAWRWGVDVMVKDLTRGVPLGPRPVTQDPEGVRRGVILSALASLLWVRWSGGEHA
jgi:hypothetical protein